MKALRYLTLFATTIAAAQPAKPTPVVSAAKNAKIARDIIQKKSCTGHVAVMATAMNVAGDELSDDERIDGNVLLARCATANKSWHALIQASAYLLDHAPDKASAQDLVAAELALGDDKLAAEMIQLIAKKIPAQAANVTAAATLLVCHKKDFQLCFDASTKMLDTLAKMKTSNTSAAIDNTLFHALSAAAIGKYDIYDTDMKMLEASFAEHHQPTALLDRIKTAVAEARASHVYIQEDALTELPIGTYHLVASGKMKDGTALVTMRLFNQAKTQRDVRLTVEIPGVTDKSSLTIALPPGKQVTKTISPPLKMDFDVTKLRVARTSQISVQLTDSTTKATLLEKELQIDLLPRDHLPLWRRVGSDGLRHTFPYAAAWITPNAPEVDAFIKAAKARLTGKDKFSGMQQGTLAQVKALFDELKSRGVSYVEDPRVFDERGGVQRTRLPAEVLASTNAQCLEGTLLYATLMEAIGLKPVLVFIKGHAFVAWKPSKFDHVKAPLLFLETTLTGTPATFEDAVTRGTHEFEEQIKNKQFQLGIAHTVDVDALRHEGYTPQPW